MTVQDPTSLLGFIWLYVSEHGNDKKEKKVNITNDTNGTQWNVTVPNLTEVNTSAANDSAPNAGAVAAHANLMIAGRHADTSTHLHATSGFMHDLQHDVVSGVNAIIAAQTKLDKVLNRSVDKPHTVTPVDIALQNRFAAGSSSPMIDSDRDGPVNDSYRDVLAAEAYRIDLNDWTKLNNSKVQEAQLRYDRVMDAPDPIALLASMKKELAATVKVDTEKMENAKKYAAEAYQIKGNDEEAQRRYDRTMAALDPAEELEAAKKELEVMEAYESEQQAGDGKKFASNLWIIFGTRFSQVFGIICIPGGHQDLPPGFY